jgi:hypothetical protein
MSDRHYSENSPFAGVFYEVGQGRIISDLLYSGVSFVANGYRRYQKRREEDRLRRETLRAIADLSPEIKRDIGWPARFEHQLRTRVR